MIDARALLVAMLDAVERDPVLAERLRRALAPVDAPLVDRDDAAAKLGIERRAIDAMIDEGKLPSRKIGRRVMVALDDVRAAMLDEPVVPVAAKSEENVVEIDPALRRRLKK